MRDIWGYGAVACRGNMTFFIGLDVNAAERGEEPEFNGVIEIVDLKGEHGWSVDELARPQVGEWYFRQDREHDLLSDPHGAWFVDATEDEEDIVEMAIKTFENSRVLN